MSCVKWYAYFDKKAFDKVICMIWDLRLGLAFIKAWNIFIGFNQSIGFVLQEKQ